MPQAMCRLQNMALLGHGMLRVITIICVITVVVLEYVHILALLREKRLKQ